MDPVTRRIRELGGWHEQWSDDRDSWRSLTTYEDPSSDHDDEDQDDEDGDE